MSSSLNIQSVSLNILFYETLYTEYASYLETRIINEK